MNVFGLKQNTLEYESSCCAYNTRFAETFDSFARKIMKEIEYEDENLVFSPFLVQQMLSMIMVGAAGETKQELVSLMEVNGDIDCICEEFRGICCAIELEGVLKVANKIIVSKSCALKDDYKAQMVKYFKSDVESLNFTDVAEVVDSINAWFAEKTGNGIKNIWKVENPFDKSETQPMKFWLTPKESVNVSMMHRKGQLRIADFSDLNARGLRLSYLYSKIEMIILLPDDINGLSLMEEIICYSDIDFLSAGRYTTVETEVFMPKFEFGSDFDVMDLLKTIGVDTLFDPTKADLSKTLKLKNQLWVTKLAQKAFIKVDEEGTTAAAMMTRFYGSGGPKYPKAPPFKIDRGFMFVIAAGSIPLFQGMVRDEKPLEVHA